jgi:hypothetical protein
MKEIARERKGQAKASSDTARFAILSLIHQATWKGFLGSSHPADRIEAIQFYCDRAHDGVAFCSTKPPLWRDATFQKTRIDCGS